ncbi:hypothetical protein DMENIID0001_050650 [Sergentomyia squamirostris]
MLHMDFNTRLQSLWVTTWCSSELQRKNQQLPPTTIQDRRQPGVPTLSAPTGSQSSEKLIVTPSSETVRTKAKGILHAVTHANTTPGNNPSNKPPVVILRTAVLTA